jgi:hypothetical protein
MSKPVPTLNEYAIECERVAIAKLILKNARMPNRAEVDAELRFMADPKAEPGIVRMPVIRKDECAALLREYQIGAVVVGWTGQTQPTSIPSSASAPASVTPKASAKGGTVVAKAKAVDNREGLLDLLRTRAAVDYTNASEKDKKAAFAEYKRADKALNEYREHRASSL